MGFRQRILKLPRVVTASEMAEVDRFTIAQLGLPGRVLMENAGRAVFECLQARWRPLRDRRAAVFCGKGNNGGDGLVIARLLALAGCACDTYLLAAPASLKGDALANYQVLNKLGLPLQVIAPGDSLPDLSAFDFVVDAILGTGVQGGLRGFLAEVVERLNAAAKPIVAVDLPTGMNADTGAGEGPCVRAQLTVTIGARKAGLLFSPAREHAGELLVADVGFPEVAFQNVAPHFWLAGDALGEWLPQRAPAAFKNRVGQILVIAGSRGFGGAARLTATATLKAGAGLVVLAAPQSLVAALEAATAEVMKLALPEINGALAEAACEELTDRLAWAEVVAIGPGLGTAAGASAVVRHVLSDFGGTIVLDADGLNVLAGQLDLVRNAKGRVILTPHPGELSRIVGAGKSELENSPITVAKQVSADLGHVLVLKDAPTVVALPTGEVMINSTGNAGMATAGSGDVLTGIIAGLAGQGLEPGMAAGLGVYLHGLAGDLAARDLGVWSLMAGDLIAYLPKAFHETQSAEAKSRFFRRDDSNRADFFGHG